MKWDHDPVLDSLTAVTPIGVYHCIRNFVDVSVLFFNREEIFRDAKSGSHEGTKAFAEEHYEARKNAARVDTGK